MLQIQMVGCCLGCYTSQLVSFVGISNTDNLCHNETYVVFLTETLHRPMAASGIYWWWRTDLIVLTKDFGRKEL